MHSYKFSIGYRLAWAEDTKNCTTLEELRTCLGRLENGLVPEVVSKLFVRNPYIVRGAWCRVKGEVASAIPGKKGEYVYLVDTPGKHWDANCYSQHNCNNNQILFNVSNAQNPSFCDYFRS